ncbi:MAG: hypothetical protein A4E53_04439 [Pelotomaculum sp. PtaB.Bin104]|nr:MAG: hypothetical protein A4E53_04439 [Pelotomaculum sp. PtaB.Bin104]
MAKPSAFIFSQLPCKRPAPWPAKLSQITNEVKRKFSNSGYLGELVGFLIFYYLRKINSALLRHYMF